MSSDVHCRTINAIARPSIYEVINIVCFMPLVSSYCLVREHKMALLSVMHLLGDMRTDEFERLLRTFEFTDASQISESNLHGLFVEAIDRI